MLGLEASMDDGFLFFGPSGTSAGPQGGGRDEPRDCSGVADQPVVRRQVDEAQARDGLRWPPAQIGGYKPRTLLGESADWLRARIAAGPFTLRGLLAELAERGIKTHPRAVWVFVHAEGLSFKKNAAGRRTDAS
jgi:hypothetical protein